MILTKVLSNLIKEEMARVRSQSSRLRWSVTFVPCAIDSVWAAAGKIEWNAEESLDGAASEFQRFEFRCVAQTDSPALLHFVRHGLSAESRRLFAPYPYHLPDDALALAFQEAIQESIERKSLTFIVTDLEKKVVAHAFLWAAQVRRNITARTKERDRRDREQKQQHALSTGF